jgi:hypothetical protein
MTPLSRYFPTRAARLNPAPCKHSFRHFENSRNVEVRHVVESGKRLERSQAVKAAHGERVEPLELAAA